ncbi:hypothetical protein [Alkaliphilus sp. B6464]|uniref:hypothetical protein n=1 Tax=Alkaliphilus sp. B6464 TaxID=2731219 RepID=UPI001BA45B1F|nr:hypothetical protein [Alkaliphilus sp. B6464]QUH21878.1 hypothetical protein HYG84_18245 [Alkaliphilus sp. B6464]
MKIIQTNQEFRLNIELLLKEINTKEPLRYILFNRGSTVGEVMDKRGQVVERIKMNNIYDELKIDKNNIVQVLYHINSRHPELIGNISIY